jgi:hypothetical protein
MSLGKSTLEAAGSIPAATASPDEADAVRVWDPFVRIFHWSLVGLFVLAFATGDEIEWLHIWAGYAIVGLVALRILWGSLARAMPGSAISSARRGRSWPICARRPRDARRVIWATIPPAAP